MVVLERLSRTAGPGHRGPPGPCPDGGLTGPAFFDHVRRSDRPVINSPKGQTSLLPPDLVRRPVVAPEIDWTRSVVRRADEARPAVLAVVDALCSTAADLGLHGPDAWLPPAIRTGADRLTWASGSMPARTLVG
ncbi:hypothetical protein M878_42980 [Streptomyces roseochromogenus subsp. oscitans DS 12.976]|uniref:Uncharacterized protein n=1 Tax=Streptomyces roseochromogenus subsp. oscitans DS 12.976 TaxID=1352936 RepID=V6JH31_STRRC|nr:hypothetical protein M878_42980 [Streptomyces roseochromogenus subsp. oscitans DS 12.976]